MAHPRVEEVPETQDDHPEETPVIEEAEDQGRQRDANGQQQSSPGTYMPDTNTQIVDMEAQNQDLQKQLRLRELQARNRQLLAELSSGVQTPVTGAAGSPIAGLPGVSPAGSNILPPAGITTTTAPVTTGAGGAAMAAPPIVPKGKSIKPEMMRAYKGQSVGEHVRWFREADIKYMMSPEYFPSDMAKIVYCMQSLEGDPAVQWYQHVDGGALLPEKTYAGFMAFLLDLVADPINRRLLAYERWEEAKQRPDQKVLAFKAHLEELEAQLPEFSQEHKAMIFLAKLKQDLKSKILSTGSVPRSREDILALAIMQEKTMERSQRGGGAADAGHQNGGHKGPKSNSKSGGNKPGNKSERHNGGAAARGSGKFGGSRDNSGPSKKSKDETDDRGSNCFICGKPGHWKNQCPDNPDKSKQSTSRVGAVDAKKEEAPPSPRKRSKKDK